ncbi:MAG: alanine--glyoxylate aminotransferase family protein [Methanomassiliicoccales archaeon]|nr:MAG: alanine--glyoxylate aminotransferase family protein [Methanomassiliicoccales archaeon]
MSRPMIIHRGKEYQKLQKGIVEKLHKALDTDLEIYLSPCSATGFLESCVRCGVKRKMVGISNGSFGDRWQQIGTANGKLVDKIDCEWGKAIRKEHIDGRISKDAEAVTIVSNESSTGVLNPMVELAEAVRDNGDPLLFVDGVTAVGAVDMRLREMRPDALVFGSQKALALPPGLAIICVSDRLLKKAEQVENRGYYFDLLEIKKFADKDLPLTTPAVSLLYGLDYQLDKWLKEGSAARFERHEAMTKMVHDWAKKRFGLFAEHGFRSRSISVIETGKFDFSEFDKKLKEKGFEVSPGYGRVKDMTFRIGHMGDLTTKDIQELLSAMDSVLEGM